MIDYIHAAAYVGIFSTLFYIPFLCYYDIRHRSIPRWFLAPLVLINAAALYILYSNGLPPMYLLLAAFLTVLYAVLHHFKAFKGADARFLIIMAWACPLNPLNPNDTFFQIQYPIFLAGVSVLWMIYVYFVGRKASIDPISFKKKSLWKKFNDYPRGSPWMIPISVAFILTVIFG